MNRGGGRIKHYARLSGKEFVYCEREPAEELPKETKLIRSSLFFVVNFILKLLLFVNNMGVYYLVTCTGLIENVFSSSTFIIVRIWCLETTNAALYPCGLLTSGGFQ